MEKLLDNPGSTARCLFGSHGLLYVGWAGPIERRGSDRLWLVDLATGKRRKTKRVPYLIADLAVAGETCVAALGDGRLAIWEDDPRLEGPPTIEQPGLLNAPMLATVAGRILAGGSSGHIFWVGDTIVADVQGQVTGLAADDTRVFGGYASGEVRVFSHAGAGTSRPKARLRLGTERASLDIDGEHLIVAFLDGTIHRLDRETLEELGRLRHPRDESFETGVISVRADAGCIATSTLKKVYVQDSAGRCLVEWAAPGRARVEDVCFDGERVLVASGDGVYCASLAPP